MFERFTEKSIKVIMLAQEESRRLGHNFIGCEQILLGLIAEGTGVASNVLKSVGIDIDLARKEVEKIIGRGAGFAAVEIPFTPNAKRGLELALEEARQREDNHIGTEHLLLGLIRVKDTVASKVLKNLGIEPLSIRDRVVEIIGEINLEQTTDSEKFIKDFAGTNLSTLLNQIDFLIANLENALEEATILSNKIKCQLDRRAIEYGDVDDILARLPDEAESEQPRIKELLTQLKTAITQEQYLSIVDRQEALDQIVVLAEAWPNLNEKRMGFFVRTALKILRGTIAELPSDSVLVKDGNRLLSAIATIFGL